VDEQMLNMQNRNKFVLRRVDPTPFLSGLILNMHGSALPIPFHYGHDMYDVMDETGSTQHITMPPEEDRTMAIGNMHKILVETGLVVLDICWTYAGGQTDRQTYSSQCSAPLLGAE